MKELSDALTDHLGNYIALFLGAFGLTMAVNQFVGGIMLALACAAISRTWDERPGGVTLKAAVTAVVFSIIAAMILQWLAPDAPQVLMTLVMGATGFFSRTLAVKLVKRQSQIVDRGLDVVLKDDDK